MKPSGCFTRGLADQFVRDAETFRRDDKVCFETIPRRSFFRGTDFQVGAKEKSSSRSCIFFAPTWKSEPQLRSYFTGCRPTP